MASAQHPRTGPETSQRAEHTEGLRGGKAATMELTEADGSRKTGEVVDSWPEREITWDRSRAARGGGR